MPFISSSGGTDGSVPGRTDDAQGPAAGRHGPDVRPAVGARSRYLSKT